MGRFFKIKNTPLFYDSVFWHCLIVSLLNNGNATNYQLVTKVVVFQASFN